MVVIESVFIMAFAAFCGAIVYPIVHNWGIGGQLAGHERRLSALEGRQGQGAPKAAQEREELAVAELITNMQGGKAIQDSLKEVALKYPDVALRYAKKFGFKL
jgi:hypothetical protein